MLDIYLQTDALLPPNTLYCSISGMASDSLYPHQSKFLFPLKTSHSHLPLNDHRCSLSRRSSGPSAVLTETGSRSRPLPRPACSSGVIAGGHTQTCPCVASSWCTACSPPVSRPATDRSSRCSAPRS